MVNLLGAKKNLGGAQEVNTGFNYLMNLCKGREPYSHQGHILFILPVYIFVFHSFHIG
jgi:hypothetical protein